MIAVLQKFPGECASERILKIGQYLVNKKSVVYIFDSRCSSVFYG